MLISMTRDKLVFQNLAIEAIGDGWKEKFNAARNDPRFLGSTELALADLVQRRAELVVMLDQYRRGEPIKLPPVRTN